MAASGKFTVCGDSKVWPLKFLSKSIHECYINQYDISPFHLLVITLVWVKISSSNLVPIPVDDCNLSVVTLQPSGLL